MRYTIKIWTDAGNVMFGVSSVLRRTRITLSPGNAKALLSRLQMAVGVVEPAHKPEPHCKPSAVSKLRVGDMVHVVGDGVCQPAIYRLPLSLDVRQWFMIVGVPRNFNVLAVYGHSVNQWHWPDECHDRTGD